MTALSKWKAGTSITYRSVGKWVFSSYPAIVVQDLHDLLALYLPAGTIGKATEQRLTPLDMMSPEGIDLVDNLWVRTDLLFLTGPEDAFSTYIMWKSRTREPSCWYINLQEPVRRTSIGIDTLDNILDIVVSPDMTQWNWKDTDEFEEAQKLGLYSKEKARQIWAEGEKAVRLLSGKVIKIASSFLCKVSSKLGMSFFSQSRGFQNLCSGLFVVLVGKFHSCCERFC